MTLPACHPAPQSSRTPAAQPCDGTGEFASNAFYLGTLGGYLLKYEVCSLAILATLSAYISNVCYCAIVLVAGNLLGVRAVLR